MTGIQQLRERAVDKSQFVTVQGYIDFSSSYLDFLETGLQATVIAQNNHSYQFFQYGNDAEFRITRPINRDLFFRHDDWDQAIATFKDALLLVRAGDPPEPQHRTSLIRTIYSLQQSIGCALDALPTDRSNQARKINGDLFERLIQLLLKEAGFDCKSGVSRVPVRDEQGFTATLMNYQHDLILSYSGELKILGSVKTSSKDRIDKIFIDKLLHNRLTGINTPHVAIFLNDVQRAKRPDGRYGISNTFLPGHFKGYTLSLNPLDGVYYCDILSSMRTDPMLSANIDTIDKFFFDDLRPLLNRPGEPLDQVQITEEPV